jgi:hypothetical protein
MAERELVCNEQFRRGPFKALITLRDDGGAGLIPPAGPPPRAKSDLARAWTLSRGPPTTLLDAIAAAPTLERQAAHCSHRRPARVYSRRSAFPGTAPRRRVRRRGAHQSRVRKQGGGRRPDHKTRDRLAALEVRQGQSGGRLVGYRQVRRIVACDMHYIERDPDAKKGLYDRYPNAGNWIMTGNDVDMCLP